MRGLRRIILINLVILSETFAVPHDSITVKYHNQIGVAGGFTIGNGLSYRRWLNDRYALQITGCYLSFTTNYRGLVSGYDKTWFNSTGISGLFAIRKWKIVRTLAYAGVSFFSVGNIDHEDIEIDSAYYPYSRWGDYRDIRELLTVGNGLGIDIYLWRVGLNVMAGLHYSYSPFKKKYLPPIPSLEAGLFFCW